MSSSGRYEPHRGTVILVLGILALVTGLGFILGPIAWIMGNADMKKIRAGTMDPTGEQQTTIGRILGMVATILGAIGCCFGIIMIIFYGAAVGFLLSNPEFRKELEKGNQRNAPPEIRMPEDNFKDPDDRK